jgi:SAM-dependent methyltransferase
MTVRLEDAARTAAGTAEVAVAQEVVASAGATAAAATAAVAHEGPVVARNHDVDVIACHRCGFRHVVPLPEPAAIDKLYTEDFYGTLHESYIASQRANLDWWHLEFGAKYDLFEELLPAGRCSLVDVGSGPGWFVQYGSRRGWRTVGVEPGRPAALHTRDTLGENVVIDFFTPAAIAHLEPVDVVHLHNVLEHVPDPAAMLRTARGALAPGGLVSVTAPNDFNPLQEALVKLRGHARWWVSPREHLNYFDRADLEALLRREGFEPCAHLASFPLEAFALMGEDYIADPALGKVVHGKRMQLEKNLHAAGEGARLAKVYRALGELGLGRTLTVMARRS